MCPLRGDGRGVHREGGSPGPVHAVADTAGAYLTWYIQIVAFDSSPVASHL
ncbi:hypothetical protein ABIA39_001054 [Nocardia sp. GAS34]